MLASIMAKYTVTRHYGQLFTHFWNFFCEHTMLDQQEAQKIKNKKAFLFSSHHSNYKIKHQLSHFPLIMVN